MSDNLTPAELVADIENYGEGLTDWESNFVSDIAGKLQKGFSLSDKQIAKLKTIHEDRVG